MNAVFAPLVDGFHLNGDLEADVSRFLILNRCPETAKHCVKVGYESELLAERHGADSAAAQAAGFLHDISAVFPNDQRIGVAKELGLEVLPEEERFPQIVHQKISGVMAREIFNVTDQTVISAVSCHTTLRSGASLLDMALFVADKIEWDQAGVPPYIERLQQQLAFSLEHAALSYLSYLWEHRQSLKVLHPWAAAAYRELRNWLT